MKKLLFKLSRIFWYLTHAKHIHGHGIHSPFAFNLITNIIEEKYPYYIYETIENERKKLLSSKQKIFTTDFGTKDSTTRKVSQIAKYSLKKKRYAQLIFRITLASKAQNILELGTSLGITTAYLASCNKKSHCYTFDGCPQSINIARSVSQSCNINNIEFINERIETGLPLLLKRINSLDVVFFDANHTESATLNYFNLCKSKITEKSVFIFDDIHSTKGMENAWKKIKNDACVRVTFDLFSIGIVYFNPHLQKQDYLYLF